MGVVPTTFSFAVRVDPGQVVSARAAGRPLFLFPGHDEEGHPVPGFHVIAEDRTFEIVERAQNKPVVQNGSSYIVTVAPGFFCKAFLNRNPLLLGAGQHMINLSGFSIPDPVRGAAVPSIVVYPAFHVLPRCGSNCFRVCCSSQPWCL
jgi:hypothetical protein